MFSTVVSWTIADLNYIINFLDRKSEWDLNGKEFSNTIKYPLAPVTLMFSQIGLMSHILSLSIRSDTMLLFLRPWSLPLGFWSACCPGVSPYLYMCSTAVHSNEPLWAEEGDQEQQNAKRETVSLSYPQRKTHAATAASRGCKEHAKPSLSTTHAHVHACGAQRTARNEDQGKCLGGIHMYLIQQNSNFICAQITMFHWLVIRHPYVT